MAGGGAGSAIDTGGMGDYSLMQEDFGKKSKRRVKFNNIGY